MYTTGSDVSIKVVGGAFKLGKKIDEGAFGKIYKAHSLKYAN